MFITRKRFERKGQLSLTLMSDLHFGAPNVDYGCMKSELEEARSHGDRVLINGDVFDMILPGDRKRFRPGALAKELQGRDEIINRVIDFAFEFLKPYADLIDMISLGNHEESVQKFHSFDPLQALVYRLNQIPGAAVCYGGTCGWVDYQLVRPVKHKTAESRSGTRWRYLVYYHHGTGGGAPVTKGIIDFNRMETWLECDLIWLSHKHNRIVDATTKRVTLSSNGNLIERPFRCVMTGGYLKSPEPDTHEGFMGGKPRSVSYAESKNLPPQEMGGARVIIPLLESSRIGRVRVIS